MVFCTNKVKFLSSCNEHNMPSLDTLCDSTDGHLHVASNYQQQTGTWGEGGEMGATLTTDS